MLDLEVYIGRFSGPLVLKRLAHLFRVTGDALVRAEAAQRALTMMKAYKAVLPEVSDMAAFVGEPLLGSFMGELILISAVETERLGALIEASVDNASTTGREDGNEEAEHTTQAIIALATMQAILHDTQLSVNTLLAASHLPQAESRVHQLIEAHWLTLMFDQKNALYLVLNQLKRNEAHAGMAHQTTALENGAYLRVCWYTLVGHFVEGEYARVMEGFRKLVASGPDALEALLAPDFNRLVDVQVMAMVVYLSLFLTTSSRDFAQTVFGDTDQTVSDGLEALLDRAPLGLVLLVDELLTTNQFSKINAVLALAAFQETIKMDIFLSPCWGAVERLLLEKQVVAYMSAVRGISVPQLAERLAVPVVRVAEVVARLVVVLDLPFRYNPLNETYYAEEEVEEGAGLAKDVLAMEQLTEALATAAKSSLVTNYVIKTFT